MNQEREITPMLVFAIFSAVLGMFQFGFNTGVINAPQKVLEEFIANVYKNRTGEWITEILRDLIWSLTVSIFAVGGMIGGIVAPMVANWCGRKTGLVLNNTVAVLGVTLMSSSKLSESIECLIIGRFFIGLNCGLNTALVPMYLTEIATVNLRGALGTVSQLGVTVGLLLSQVLGLKDALGNEEYWPFLFGCAFIPAILQLIMLPFCPESPRYLLLSCGRISDARLALRRLRNRLDIEDDIEEMRAEERAHQEEVRKYGKLSSVRELFSHPWLRTPLIIGIMMQLSQQLSGINAIFYYSTDIFLSAEVPETYAVYATIGVGAIMVITTLVSIPLMDRLGRRTLHLYGLAGMFLASIFLTISLLVKFLYDWMKYISVISILLYTLFFGIGPGSIPLMITAELFTQGSRPAAMSVSVLVNWFSNFAVGLTFPLMKQVLYSYLFLPFTVFLAIFWVFTYKKLPETKNRTFEEIAAIFRPIQLDATASAFPDYGCAFASLGLPPDSHSQAQITPGSMNTPNLDGGGLGGGGGLSGGGGGGGSALNTARSLNNNTNSNTNQTTNNGSLSHQNAISRFRFDTASTCNYLDEQRRSMVSACGLTNGTVCHDSRVCHSIGSQGNLNQIPLASCTSIAQYLSTSDQQPLIVDVPLDRCQHHNQHPHQHHHHPQQQQRHHSIQHQHSKGQDNNLSTSQCCLKTTSFMDDDNNQSVAPNVNCSCFEKEHVKYTSAHKHHQLQSQQQPYHLQNNSYAASNGFSADGFATAAKSQIEGCLGAFWDEQKKSRTLTKVYKPLNDLHIPYASTNNLVDNFYIPSNDMMRKKQS